jgi:hypothetical protein
MVDEIDLILVERLNHDWDNVFIPERFLFKVLNFLKLISKSRRRKKADCEDCDC